MDGFKDSTRMKYMCGGPVKKATGGPVKMFEGGTYNERGKRATMAEIAAEDRRMAASAAAKKPMPKKMPDSATAARLAGAAGAAAGKMGAAAGAAAGKMGAAQAAQAAETALLRRTTGAAMTEGERRAILAAAKKAVPAHSDRPMIRRKAGGLASMPKGKC
jgi:hypothetical protein